jgi:glycine dehydrogenase subunit 1
MVTAATIYMALVGPEGLRRIATQSHANTLTLVEKLEGLAGIKRAFNGPVFHEAVISLPAPAEDVLDRLKTERILGGLNLRDFYPELGNAMLVCATETKTSGDLENYAERLKKAING